MTNYLFRFDLRGVLLDRIRGLYFDPNRPNSLAFKTTFAAIGAAVLAPYPPPSTTTAIAT